MISLRSFKPVLAMLVPFALAACGSTPVSPDAAPASTAAADASAVGPVKAPGIVNLAPSSSAAPPQGVGAQKRAYPIVAGTSCQGHGRAEDPERPLFHRHGNTWSREEKWGCGCPTRDVFTMVYEPKTSPLRVRICVDPEADRCEALCQSSLEWNLEGALKEAGATEVKFVE
ncbi:MAG: hypothetical protein U0359_20545 [Byssovorax sp.]